MAARRQVSYQWRLREVMAAAGLFNASDLEPLLADRGITLSSVQVWRLVTQTPERLSLPVLAALCDIFDVTPAQLIATRAENAPAGQQRLQVGRVEQPGRGHHLPQPPLVADLPPGRHHALRPGRIAAAAVASSARRNVRVRKPEDTQV